MSSYAVMTAASASCSRSCSPSAPPSRAPRARRRPMRSRLRSTIRAGPSSRAVADAREGGRDSPRRPNGCSDGGFCYVPVPTSSRSRGLGLERRRGVDGAPAERRHPPMGRNLDRSSSTSTRARAPSSITFVGLWAGKKDDVWAAATDSDGHHPLRALREPRRCGAPPSASSRRKRRRLRRGPLGDVRRQRAMGGDGARRSFAFARTRAAPSSRTSARALEQRTSTDTPGVASGASVPTTSSSREGLSFELL